MNAAAGSSRAPFDGALGMPFKIEGRDLSAADTGAAPVAIIHKAGKIGAG